MADIDVLPQRGVHPLALVGANGVAIGGSATVAQLAAKGMQSICQVDATGIASSDGTSTVAQLASRGIRTFAAVDELGVSTDDAVSKADAIRMRGIRPMVAVDANGVSQTGSATIPVLAQRGLSYFCPVDETGTAASLIPVPPNTIRARPGIFAYNGEPMTPTTGYMLTAGAGAFPFAGQSATLTPPAPAFTTWDAAHKTANITLSNGSLTAAATAGGEEVRTIANHTTGKYFFSIAMTSGSTIPAIVNSAYVLGAGNPAGQLNSIGVHPNGNFSANSAGLGTYAGFVGGDTVDIAFDLGGQLIWARTNGGAWNSGGTANPATGVGGVSTAGVSGPYYPLVWFANSGISATANFGATTYPFAKPAGFLDW